MCAQNLAAQKAAPKDSFPSRAEVQNESKSQSKKVYEGIGRRERMLLQEWTVISSLDFFFFGFILLGSPNG